MAEESPQPKAAAEESGPSIRPVSRDLGKVQQFSDNAEAKVAETSGGIGRWIRKVLRFEAEEPTDHGFLANPFYTAGHIIDGTALNVARRNVEITSNIPAAIRAAYRSTIGTILHPVKAISNLIETLKNPARFISSGIKMAVDSALAIPRAIDEFTERAVANGVAQVNTQLEKVPIVKDVISKPTNWLTRGISKVVGMARKGLEWICSPATQFHEACAPC